ncbi:hypothetical protein [Acidovorax soli]|uniref:hypothetical protein n=1 Tax=Acidovorax soli TaxID=592050 RepID=UPI0032B1E1B3
MDPLETPVSGILLKPDPRIGLFLSLCPVLPRVGTFAAKKRPVEWIQDQRMQRDYAMVFEPPDPKQQTSSSSAFAPLAI